jgi:hypothetical protein
MDRVRIMVWKTWWIDEQGKSDGVENMVSKWTGGKNDGVENMVSRWTGQE